MSHKPKQKIPESQSLQPTTQQSQGISSKLETGDRNALINLLVSIPEMGDRRSRQSVLENAGLEQFVNYGSLDNENTALGQLLIHVKKYTGIENKKLIDSLIQKYQLKVINNKENITASYNTSPQNLPRSGIKKFVGRDELLKQLDTKLRKSDRLPIWALTGMGGVGKTELALQYALKYQDNYPGGLCWLQVKGADLGTQIVDFGRALLNLKPPENLGLVAQVQYCWRNWIKGTVLIVLDDLIDYKKIVPYLPPAKSQFKVLITTRLQLVDLTQSLNIDV